MKGRDLESDFKRNVWCLLGLPFDALSKLHNDGISSDWEYCIKTIESISEALVYEMYFGNDYKLQKELAEHIGVNESSWNIPN